MKEILEEKEQKNMKLTSKILFIVSKIMEVCCFIGLAGIVLTLIIVPIIFKSIDLDNRTIKFGDEEIKYEINDNTLTIYENGKKVENGEITIDSKFVELIESHSTDYYTYLIESVLCVVVVILILTICLLKNSFKLFKNINELETPFVKENIDYLNKMAKYCFIIWIVSVVGFSIIDIISGAELNINVGLTELLFVLIIVCMSSIFTYGCKLEEKKTN